MGAILIESRHALTHQLSRRRPAARSVHSRHSERRKATSDVIIQNGKDRDEDDQVEMWCFTEREMERGRKGDGERESEKGRGRKGEGRERESSSELRRG